MINIPESLLDKLYFIADGFGDPVDKIIVEALEMFIEECEGEK